MKNMDSKLATDSLNKTLEAFLAGLVSQQDMMPSKFVFQIILNLKAAAQACYQLASWLYHYCCSWFWQDTVGANQLSLPEAFNILAEQDNQDAHFEAAVTRLLQDNIDINSLLSSCNTTTKNLLIATLNTLILRSLNQNLTEENQNLRVMVAELLEDESVVSAVHPLESSMGQQNTTTAQLVRVVETEPFSASVRSQQDYDAIECQSVDEVVSSARFLRSEASASGSPSQVGVFSMRTASSSRGQNDNLLPPRLGPSFS